MFDIAHTAINNVIAWAAGHRKTLECYVRGYLAGLAFLYDAENKDESVAVLRKNLPHMPPELAAQYYTTMVGPKGFERSAEIDVAGVRTVLELRSEYGRPATQLTDPTRYYDPSFYEAARR